MDKVIPPLQITRFPVIDVDPADGRSKLIGSCCAACDKITFPSSGACSGCGGTEVAPRFLSERGALYSFSVLHVGARGWPAPYVLAYVDLPEGVRVFSHIDAAPESLRLDMHVQLRRRDPISNPEGNQVLEYVFQPASL